MLHHVQDPLFIKRHAEIYATPGQQTARTPNHPGQGENVITCKELQCVCSPIYWLDTPPTSRHLHLHHGITRAALSPDLLTVVHKRRFINCLVFDRQAAVHGYLRQCHCKTEKIRSVRHKVTLVPKSVFWVSTAVGYEMFAVYFFTEKRHCSAIHQLHCPSVCSGCPKQSSYRHSGTKCTASMWHHCPPQSFNRRSHIYAIWWLMTGTYWACGWTV